MIILFQLLLVAVWSLSVGRHLRRLYRLAVVPVVADRSSYLRTKASRMWWWLGRSEFWSALERDTLRCLELTVLLAVCFLLG